ncbi:transcription elongation factor GreA [Candidatus Woesebacteria bacterium]|nr:transcription elongation factor GreA [Candidatus Woesebacteria bacterium]
MPQDPQAQIELTQEGLDELTKELEELKQVKLPEAVERVARAREHGDLSENAEYHSAQDDQQLVQARIEEIELILAKATVVKQTTGHNKVGMGSTIVLQKKGDKNKTTFTIVGEFEANPGENRISVASPIGKAVMGKKKGDTVIVHAPVGDSEYTIIDIK